MKTLFLASMALVLIAAPAGASTLKHMTCTTYAGGEFKLLWAGYRRKQNNRIAPGRSLESWHHARDPKRWIVVAAMNGKMCPFAKGVRG